jgi:hypothetical protein
MMLKFASPFCGAAILAVAVTVSAQSPERPMHASNTGAACATLKARTFGDATVVESTPVPAGSLRISDTVTIADLPSFCRVQGVSKPTADSNIQFEVWLPDAATWNRKLLSTGEGGFAGQLNYQRNGLDGAMDENLRRGYATASTDTGHVSSEQWWAIGHPEKVTDYLYRAKHVTTVAAKAIIAAYYGQPPARSYFNSCSNGGRQGLMEAQKYREDFDGLIIGAPWNFQSHSNAGFIWDAQAGRSGRANSGRDAAGHCEGCHRGVRQERWSGRQCHRRPLALRLRSQIVDMFGRCDERMPDAAASRRAAEDLRRSQESSDW